MRYLLLFLLTLASAMLSVLPATAQTTDTLSVEDIVLELLEVIDPERETHDGLAEELSELLTHPIDLNTATPGALSSIPFVDGTLSRRMISARRAEGPFTTLDEAFEAAGIDSEDARRLRPFLRVEPPRTAPLLVVDNVSARFIHRLTRRIDLGPGFSDDTTRTTYLGRPERLYSRLQVQAGPQLAGTLTLDNRPGEPLAWDPSRNTYGVNHVAGHLRIRNVGPLESLLVGDYTMLLGQGLVLWRSTAFGKGRETVRPASRQQNRIAPYASTGRNEFFRGAAMQLRLTTHLVLTGMASSKAVDATMEESPDAESPYRIVAFPTSGLYRTSSERERKAAAGQEVIGGALTYEGASAQLGVAALQTRFDHPVVPSDAPHRLFEFAGRSARIVTAFGTLDLSSARLFGESARDHRGRIGAVAGIQGTLGGRGRAVVSARHFPKDFVSLHGAAFSERSGPPANETGLYLGIDLPIHSAWRIAGYFDTFRFPWARFGVERPSSGYEVLALAEYRPAPRFTAYVQARSKTREEGLVLEPPEVRVPVAGVAKETRQSIRFHLSHQLARALRLQSRLELTRFLEASGEAFHGSLLYQDVRWAPLSSLQLDGRITLFEAEHFGARLYAYENDLFYAFSVPMLSGVGQRTYLMARWSPRRVLTFELKVAKTRLEHVDAIGSGLDEVEGNRLREVRVQLRWRL